MLKRPCSKCGKPVRQATCDECLAKIPRQPGRRTDTRSPRQRGYDAEYDRNRAELVRLTRLYGAPCAICGQPFAPGETITAEHVIPLRAGGTSALANLAPAHRRCNSAWRRGRRRRLAPRSRQDGR